MTLRHFQIFTAVVDEKTMHQAAETLYISQPSVSQAIRELEEYYGVALFERYKKRLILTAEGERLLGYCRKLLTQYQALNQAMEENKSQPLIRIGASVSVGEEMLVPIIREFEKEFPHIRTQIVVHNTEYIEKELLNGQLDLGLLESDVLSPDFILEPFCRDRMLPVITPDHPLAGRKSVELKELAGFDLITREQESSSRNLLLHLMDEQKIPYHVKWSCTNVHTMKQAALAGQGIALLSSMVVSEELERGLLYEIPVAGLDGSREIRFVIHKDKHIGEEINAFRGFCMERYNKSGYGSSSSK
jgi:DNA-binding transcriptional LysR family regulator